MRHICGEGHLFDYRCIATNGSQQGIQRACIDFQIGWKTEATEDSNDHDWDAQTAKRWRRENCNTAKTQVFNFKLSLYSNEFPNCLKITCKLRITQCRPRQATCEISKKTMSAIFQAIIEATKMGNNACRKTTHDSSNEQASISSQVPQMQFGVLSRLLC
jgi:hypothetical protein